MVKAKVAVTLDEHLLRDVDRWVAAGEFASRSGAVEEALRRLGKQRLSGGNLLAELAKLDPEEEVALAEERFVADVAWPEY